MTVFEKTDRFLRNLYETAFYFAVMAVKENFRNYVGLAGTVFVVARYIITGIAFPECFKKLQGRCAVFVLGKHISGK